MSKTTQSYLVDTNILLRFLMDDEPKQSPITKELFMAAQNGQISLKIPLLAITETVFTLQTYYRVDRQAISRELSKILLCQGVTLTSPVWILNALEEYGQKNVSFGDACLAAEARALALTVASFDQGLKKFPGLKRFDLSKKTDT